MYILAVRFYPGDPFSAQWHFCTKYVAYLFMCTLTTSVKISVADPDPGPFWPLDPGSGMGKKNQDPYPE
jgi:hypothetical protein